MHFYSSLDSKLIVMWSLSKEVTKTIAHVNFDAFY